MSIFNEKQIEAMFGGGYICCKCGSKMEFEDEWEETLICTKCSFEQNPDHYGYENEDEIYEALYMTKEEVLARDGVYEEDGDEGEEEYEEVGNELSK